jgi:acetyl-CoA carboxylase carboxyltransferase component
MRPIIEAVVDTGSFFEIGGLWTAASSAKLEPFENFVQTFYLPLVHLVDNPGFMIGKQAEQEATIRAGARALTAVNQVTVPWCTVIIRKVFGVAGAGNQNHTRFHYSYARPRRRSRCASTACVRRSDRRRNSRSRKSSTRGGGSIVSCAGANNIGDACTGS